MAFDVELFQEIMILGIENRQNDKTFYRLVAFSDEYYFLKDFRITKLQKYKKHI